MTDRRVPTANRAPRTETGVAAAGTVAGVAALFSAAACCVLPLALAGAGIGAVGLSSFVPYRWPLTTAAAVAIAAAWVLYLRKRRARAADASGAAPVPSTATLALLLTGTVVVAVSAMWGMIEQPLMRTLGGV